jgi:hypothetical protein
MGLTDAPSAARLDTTWHKDPHRRRGEPFSSDQSGATPGTSHAIPLTNVFAPRYGRVSRGTVMKRMLSSLIRSSLLGLCLLGACGSATSDHSHTSPIAEAGAGGIVRGEPGHSAKCELQCKPNEHCELQLVACDESDCPWAPTCSSQIDPCATVMCPATSVCVVTLEHRNKCAPRR